MRRTARSSEQRRRKSVVSGGRRGGPRGGGAPSVVVAQRTCVACRSVRAKRDLVRIVRSPSGELAVDLRGKATGRGAYLDPDASCLERGLREGAIAKALEVTIDAGTAERLRKELDDAAIARRKETR
jgi:predicted RNA-binding protein YlxR (DUF448 family)